METNFTPPRSNSRRFRRPDPSLDSRMGQTSTSPDIASGASETMETTLTPPSSTPRSYHTPDSSPNSTMGRPLAARSRRDAAQPAPEARSPPPYSAVGLPLANPSWRRDSIEPAPKGPFSCVFTDIVDSTALWEFDSSAMEEARKLHDNSIRPYIDRFHGYEVKTIGDGFHIVFKNALETLTFCICVQIVICNLEWPAAILEYHATPKSREKTREPKIAYECLAIRMGCHFGMPYSEELNLYSQRMDYYGPMVNRSARVQGQAFGGEIAVSDEFIREIWRLQTNDKVDTTVEMTDATRRRILRKIVPTKFCDIKFLGLLELKGVEEEMYITLICCPTRLLNGEEWTRHLQSLPPDVEI